MRSQRRAPVTVQLVSNAREGENGLGDYTEDPTTVEVEGAIFEPERAFQRTAERAGDTQAPVFQPAAFNVPGVYELTSDDEVHTGSGDDLEIWYVTGGSTVWLDRTNIPVSRTREA